jgi:hypothetical protein
VAIECKEVEDDDLVAEEIDDNAAYKSDDDTPLDDDEESLLVEPEQAIEEDGDLKRREKLLLFEKKIFENQKRKKELMSLKEQGEKELLVKMDRAKFERILQTIREGSDEEIEKVVLKELNSAGGTSKFYKIFYWQMEIDRCELNIQSCLWKSQELADK